MSNILKRFGGLLVQAFLILLGAASLLVFARDGFHFFMQDFFSGLLILSETILDAFFAFPPFHALIGALKAAIAALLARFGFPDIVVQPHWKQAFVLLSLGMYNYADAVRDFAGRPATTVFRYGSAFLSALLGGLMAGTVHLAHIGVAIWPQFAICLFVGMNALPRALSEQRRHRDIIWVSLVFGAAFGFAVSILTIKQTVVFSSASPSEGLKNLALAVALFAMISILFGFSSKDRGSEQQMLDNPGRKMGLRLLSILSVAAVLAVLGQWAWNWTGRLSASAVGIPAAGESFRDCGEASCPDMVVIPAGRFTMGTTGRHIVDLKFTGRWDDSFKNELPSREVEVPAFALAISEATIAEFKAFIKATGYRPSGVCGGYNRAHAPGYWPELDWRDPGFVQATEDHPVVCVTWWDAQAYARWLSLKTGERYRLPSEAEWEYAARGGTRTLYFWGDDPERACEFSNGADPTYKLTFEFSTRDCYDSFLYTAPTASYAPNPYGLSNMIGNVWEWTEDCYASSYAHGQPTDGRPHTRENCQIRVLRGSSWDDYPNYRRSAIRGWDIQASRVSNIGFRLARTLSPPAP